MLNRIVLLSSLVLISSCSLFASRSGDESQKITERDVAFNARKSQEPRKRVIVLPFLDATQKTSQVPEVARKSLIRQLALTDQIVVVDSQDLPRDISTLKKGEDYDLEAIAKLAGGLGIAGVLEGKILEVKAQRLGDQVGLFRKVRAQHEAVIRIRLISARNGKELLNENRSASVEATTTLVGSRSERDQKLAEDPQLVRESVTKAFKGVVSAIVTALRKMSWEGRIAMVQGDKIFVNAGRISGLQVGDILKVMENGEAVYDPETGELIGTAPGRVKGTVEIVSYFGKDGTVAIVHSGAGFQESDPVELY